VTSHEVPVQPSLVERVASEGGNSTQIGERNSDGMNSTSLAPLVVSGPGPAPVPSDDEPERGADGLVRSNAESRRGLLRAGTPALRGARSWEADRDAAIPRGWRRRGRAQAGWFSTTATKHASKQG